MRAVRLAPWILAAILASTACHGAETEVEQETATTTKIEEHTITAVEGESTTAVEEQPSTIAEAEKQPATTKVEECSWCPAPDPSGTTAAQQPASSQPDLMNQLQSTAGGTAFADVSEDGLLSDIRAICEAWKGDTSLEDVTARVSLARAELLGASESEPGLAAYTQLLETSADQRCLRDPTR